MNLATSQAKNYSPQPEGRAPVRVETPYTRARAEWDARIGSAAVQSANWRLALICTLSLLGVSFIGIFYLATRASVVPHIVEVDSLGAATYRGPAGSSVTPSEAVVRHELARFIELTRTLSSDAPLLRQRLVDVDKLLTTRAQAAYRQWGKDENPMEQAKTKTTAVEIESAVPLSHDTWQVDWQERAWDRSGNSLGKPVLWRAMLKVAQMTPKTPQQMQNNPLGIYIDEFHWNRIEALRKP